LEQFFPGDFHVWEFYTHNGEQHKARVASKRTLEDARAAVAENARYWSKQNRSQRTCGGLIPDSDATGRTFRIYRATGWELVEETR
jgi:hypothetical protein